MNEPPDSASKEKETPKIMDESKKPLNSTARESGDKLGMIPAVNLSKLDINKIQTSIKLKLQSKKVKRLGPKSKTSPIGPKNKTENVKGICPKSRASPKKNATKEKPVAQNTTTKVSVTTPCSLSSLDEKDFVSGVCLICRLKSDKCTNIFNDTKKFDHIIQRFLPISVNQNNVPKTVCKNCLSVLIAVENLSLQNSNEKPAEEKPEAVEISSDDDDSHFVDDVCVEEDIEESEKSKNSKSPPYISLIPTSMLISPSKLPSRSSSIPGPSTSKSLVPTTRIKSSSKISSPTSASGIEIISTFSLSTEECQPKTKTAAPVIESEPKKVQSTVVIKSRPPRKVVPPAKFANFESSVSKPKGKKVTSVKKESEENSISLPIETGNKKKIQYVYDVATGKFTDESTEVEKPVSNQPKRMPKKDSNMSEIDLKASLAQRERLKEYKKTVHSLRKHITTGESAEKERQENASESETPAVEPPVEKEKELLVNAHDPTNLVDISPVMVSYSVSKNIQNLLRLTKKCLNIKVLVPNDKNTSDKSSDDSSQAIKDATGKETSDSTNSAEAASEESTPKATQPESKPLKKYLETQVEVFSNVIKGYLIPVYFKVLSDSFPSDKVKRTVFTTVSKILAKKKKDAMASLEAETFLVAPSLFKRLQDTFDSSQAKQLCVKCNKRFLRSEIMSHIKFTHLPQCLSCKMVCHSSEALEHHQCICHSADFKKCAVCKRPYQSWSTRVVVHCEHWFRCAFCGQGFLDHNNYMKHERKHFDSDFLEYMYMLKPDFKENLDFLQIKSEVLEKLECSLIDYFWDKENFPAISFLTSKEKVFCFKCLLAFEDRPIFKNHICQGEDKCLRFNFATLKCCKCHKAFKSKGTFYRHYQECVDHSFNVTRALQVGSALIEIECALCSNRYYSMEMINDHFDDCYRKNVFQCGFCQMKVTVHAKEQHLKKCETTSAKEKQENALQGTADNPVDIDNADDLNTSTGSVLDSQEKATADKAVNNDSEVPKELPSNLKETEESAAKEKQLPAVVSSTSSQVANLNEDGMDALLNESRIDFSETVCSTPISKKFKKDKEVESSEKLTDNQVTKTVPEVAAINETGCQVGGTVPEKSAESLPVIDLDALESNLACIETVETDVKEGTEANQSTLADLEAAAMALQPTFIKKCFSVKILTTSTDGTPGKVQGEKLKSAENLDPNSKELQKLVEESEQAAEIKDVLNVSYAVFFTEVNGKHLPHHFRLTTPDLSQDMKDKASSVIKSLLVKERKKVFKEGSAAEKMLVPMPQYHARVQKTQLQPNLVNKTRPTQQLIPFNRGIVRVVCMFCKETFLRSDLRQHILETHMVQCTKCSVYLTSSGELLNHVSIVHNEPYSTCFKCCKKFPSEEDPLTCPCSFNCHNCDKVFDNWLQYLDHELTHYHETAFDHAKEANPNAFVMERLRGSLEASRSANLIYTCQICGKRYSTEDDVIKCTHTYKCVACKTVFNCYSLLATHGCSFRYTTNKIKKEMRRNHIQQVKEAKFIHLCPICNVRFDSPSLYSTHYTMCAESSEKPVADLQATYWVKCPYCLRDYNSDDTFLRHHFDCQKANSFLCEVCNDYISNYNKEAHLKECVQEILCDNCGVSFSNRTTYNFHFRQQRDGTVTCKSLITDDDGQPFETVPDPEIVMKSIQDGTFDLTACNYCGKMFNNPRKTSKHIIESHLDKVKSCPVCNARLSRSKSSLLAHRKSHSTAELVAATKGGDFGPFRCFKCSKCFSSSYHKILHQIYYHQKEILCCSLCQKEFVSKLCLHNHQMTCSEPKEVAPKTTVKKVGKDYTCQTCNTPFTNYQEYVEHKKIHATRYACDMCPKTFLSKHIMNDHKKRIHFGTPSTCEICGSAFGCLKNLQNHQKNQHMNQPPCICDTCGKSFKTSKHLRVHVTLHTGEKPYACKHCDRRFRLKQNLTQHEYKHSNDPKPFKCTLCLAKFTQFNNLHLHKRQVHPETFKYMCPKCKCGYNDLNYFTKHLEVCGLERRVTGKKHINNGVPRAPRTCIKECPYCNENVESLRIHLLRRTDEKPYFCKTCPKKFSYLCTLKHHELQHFNSKKFTCKFCDKGFLGLKQYSFHLQMKHNDLFPLHCAHCSKGYNDNKYYYKHIQECNEFIEKPLHHPNSKKLTPECYICNKIFLKFNDLRIHSAMVHKTQAHKRYQCQICDSAYDSNALLLKHSKHHFKDRRNPGMFLCPKCQFQHHDFKSILNHNCPFLTNLGDPDASVSSPSKRASSSNYTEPAKKRKSSRVTKKPAALLQFESDDEDVADFSDDDEDSSSVEDKKIEDTEEFEEYREYNVNDILVEPPEEKVDPDTFQINPENVIEETVADNSNFIYHCSFCKENFDTLTRLQNHLRKDHGFDLNNLEFQVI